MRFHAVTEAPARWNGTQQRGRVSEQREGAGEKNSGQNAESPVVLLPRGNLVEESEHGRILLRTQKKTDSPRSSKILLPKSWN
jgi:hypothetical protein